MAEGDTFINALIGGIASIVLFFLPFSPVLGGILAGYLQGGERAVGVRIGVYAGIVAAIPFALFVLFLVAGVGFVAVSPMRGGAGMGVFAFFFLFAVVTAVAYTVALSAAGGWLGNYIRYDTDLLE